MSLSVEDFALAGDSSNNQVKAAGALLDRLRELLGGTTLPLPTKEQVLKIIGEAYDKYVAPMDLPGVPNIFEPWADAALRAVILQAAGRIYDALAS